MNKTKNWLEVGDRSYLKNILPLDTPLGIEIEPIRNCNFRCIYCNYGCNYAQTKTDSKFDLNLFEKFIIDAEKFKSKIRSIGFGGLGEPLLHSELHRMIELSRRVTDSTLLVTNGSLLSHKKIDELASSGLTRIRISLQGLNAEEYEQNCGVKIDFNKFVSNLSCLRKNFTGEIYLKMPSFVLNSEEKYNQFHDIFSNLADGLAIQTIVNVRQDVSINIPSTETGANMYGGKFSHIEVCPQPFYKMIINSNGTVTPCCMNENGAYIIGDIHEDEIVDIWNGKKISILRRVQIMKKRYKIKVCRNCNIPMYMMNEYDYIDDYADQLKLLYSK